MLGGEGGGGGEEHQMGLILQVSAQADVAAGRREEGVVKSTSPFRSVRRLGEEGRRGEGVVLMGEDGLSLKVGAQCQDKGGGGTLMRSVKREGSAALLHSLQGNECGGHTAALLAGDDEEGGGHALISSRLLHSLQCGGGGADEEIHEQVGHGAAVEALREGGVKVHGKVYV